MLFNTLVSSTLTEKIMDPIAQASLLSVIHPKISDYENDKLLRAILEHEIKEAIWSMHLDKTLGTDGFIINFYWVVLDIIKGYLRRILDWTRKKDKIGGATNT